MLPYILVVSLFRLLAAEGAPIPRAAWKESGWISTCAGMGCTGYGHPCASYTVGGVTRYCYWE